MRYSSTNRRAEEYKGHNQHGRVEDILVIIALRKEFLFGVPSLMHNVFVDLISGCVPLETFGAGEGTLVRKA